MLVYFGIPFLARLHPYGFLCVCVLPCGLLLCSCGMVLQHGRMYLKGIYVTKDKNLGPFGLNYIGEMSQSVVVRAAALEFYCVFGSHVW